MVCFILESCKNAGKTTQIQSETIKIATFFVVFKFIIIEKHVIQYEGKFE